MIANFPRFLARLNRRSRRCQSFSVETDFDDMHTQGCTRHSHSSKLTYQPITDFGDTTEGVAYFPLVEANE